MAATRGTPRPVEEPLVDLPAVEKEEQIDDWNLEFDFHVFAQHEARKISSPHVKARTDGERYILVECVESLTPVDMMNLGSGIHDATGHCVWMGAFLLMDALPLLGVYFHGKRVIELGCGTGIGGIALVCSENALPSMLTLTDADPNALELCGRNCEHNTLDPSQYSVVPLTWGEKLAAGLLKDGDPKFDTVLATDVLYDIGLLPPLFRTAVDCLGGTGTFVLSHVPRACYSSDHPPVNNLEDHIIERAREFGFHLTKLLRPSDLGEEPCRPRDALNADVSLNEMGQVGAAILIFDLR